MGIPFNVLSGTAQNVTFMYAGNVFDFGKKEYMPLSRKVRLNQDVDESLVGHVCVRDNGGYVFESTLVFKRLPKAKIDALYAWLGYYPRWIEPFYVNDSTGCRYWARLIGDFKPVLTDAGYYDLSMSLRLTTNATSEVTPGTDTADAPYFCSSSNFYVNFPGVDVKIAPQFYSEFDQELIEFENFSFALSLNSIEKKYLSLQLRNINQDVMQKMVRFFERSDVNWCKNKFTVYFDATFTGLVRLVKPEFNYQLTEKPMQYSVNLMFRKYF